MKNLQETADKFAAVEALYRYAAGLDLRDNNLLYLLLQLMLYPILRLPGKKPALSILYWKAGKLSLPH